LALFRFSRSVGLLDRKSTTAHAILQDISNALIQKVIVRTLQTSPLPIETCTAADAAEATRLLDEQPIHLALLDVELPDLSGFELCGRIRAHAKVSGVPIFMLTGRGDVDAKAEAFRAGADDYLVKPVVPEELVLRVVRALERNYGAKVTGTQVVGATLAARSEPLPAPEELSDPDPIAASVEPLAAAPLVTTEQELPPEPRAPIRPSALPLAPAPRTNPEPRPETALFKTKPEARPEHAPGGRNCCAATPGRVEPFPRPLAAPVKSRADARPGRDLR